MKKITVVALIFGLLLTGCQQKTNGTLDTTNLVKTEPEGNVTEEQLKSIPINYQAPSVQEGLEALPFKIKLPSEFPFEACR